MQKLTITKQKSYSTIDLFEYVLPIFLAVGMYLPFFMPDLVSNIVKPLFIILCFSYLLIKNKAIFGKNNTIVFIFIFIYLFATIRSANSSGLNHGISTLLYLVSLFFIIACNFSEKSIQRSVVFLVFGGIIFSFGVFASNPFFGTNWMNRTFLKVFGLTMNSNQVVYPVLIGLASLMILFIKTSAKYRLLMAFPALLSIYCILLTMSRSGFLCLLFMSIVFIIYLFFSSKNKFRFFIYLLVFAFIVVILVRFVPVSIISRLTNYSNYASDSSGRIEMFYFGLSSVNNVFFGDGSGAFQALGHSGKMHNLFINIYMETGIFGLVVFFMVLIPVFKTIRTPFFIFIIPMLFQALFESGDAYTFWVPVYLLLLVSNSIAKQKKCLCKENIVYGSCY